MKTLRLAAAALVALTVTAAPLLAENAAAMRRALAAAGAKDWPMADQAARQSGPLATDLVLWQRLRAGQGTWAEYSDFAARNADWPGMALFWRRGEAVMTPTLPPLEVLAWFGDRRPLTWRGAQAWIAAQPPAKRDAAIADFWVHNAAMEPADETAFLAAYGTAAAPHHAERLTALLDAGEWAAAERMLPLVSGASADLARARIAVQARRTGVDALILKLPAAARDDAGLALDRFRWRVAAKQGDLARDLMLERSSSAAALGDPKGWASRRKDYARAALRAGDWALAEKLAANHFLPGGDEDGYELDWLAGYAALRASAPDRAAQHFARLPVAGSGPITLSRSHYWQGRAAEAQGDAAAARAAYTRAAAHQTAFYGQLAAEKIGVPMDPALAIPGRATESLPDWRGAALTENPVFQAGVWFIAAGDPQQGQRFFLHLAETAPPDDIARMARLMLEMHRPWDALRLGKAAAAKGGVWPAIYHPLTGLETKPLGLPPDLVMSIARRESEFNHTVSSPAGAKGLMQVMPDTARQMARVIGEPYDLPRLTTDAAYNARLGSAYLHGLRDRFGGSVALVAAGYNAGPGRSARWLRDFGDLRDAGREGADPVDWVEMIPFDETRTYVMRVAESLPMYRARIAGQPVPLVPTWDLRGGELAPLPQISPLVLALSDRPPGVPGWVVDAASQARVAAGWPDAGRAERLAFLETAEGGVSSAESSALIEGAEPPQPAAQIAAVAPSLPAPPRATRPPSSASRPAAAGSAAAAQGVAVDAGAAEGLAAGAFAATAAGVVADGTAASAASSGAPDPAAASTAPPDSAAASGGSAAAPSDSAAPAGAPALPAVGTVFQQLNGAQNYALPPSGSPATR